MEKETHRQDPNAPVEDYHLASAEEIKNLPPLFCYLMGKLNEDDQCLPKKRKR